MLIGLRLLLMLAALAISAAFLGYLFTKPATAAVGKKPRQTHLTVRGYRCHNLRAGTRTGGLTVPFLAS